MKEWITNKIKKEMKKISKESLKKSKENNLLSFEKFTKKYTKEINNNFLNILKDIRNRHPLSFRIEWDTSTTDNNTGYYDLSCLDLCLQDVSNKDNKTMMRIFLNYSRIPFKFKYWKYKHFSKDYVVNENEKDLWTCVKYKIACYSADGEIFAVYKNISFNTLLKNIVKMFF